MASATLLLALASGGPRASAQGEGASAASPAQDPSPEEGAEDEDELPADRAPAGSAPPPGEPPPAQAERDDAAAADDLPEVKPDEAQPSGGESGLFVPEGEPPPDVPQAKPADYEPELRDLDQEPYRTPRAGEGFKTELFGEAIELQPRDRSDFSSISLGLTWFSPKIGDTSFVPLGAVFLRQYWLDPEEQQTETYVQVTVSGLVNQFTATRDLGGLDLFLHAENDYRRLFGGPEIVDGEELEGTELEWGWALAGIGPAYRTRVWPGNLDNELLVALSGHAGYYYFDRVRDETDPDLRLPPDTWVWGGRVRLRLDMLQRNLLELPHEGIALGGDLELTRRDRWRDFGPRLSLDPSAAERTRATRDYLKLSAFFVATSGIPFLSERHRIEAQVRGGWSPHDDLDRFSAFRIGGGPLPKESSDLDRRLFPGAGFDQFMARWYFITSIEYRFEVLFFLYLHLRASYFKSEIPQLREAAGLVRFEADEGTTYTAALTSGFLWESQLYVEYTFGTGVIRGGDSGHTVLLMWSKDF